MSYRNLKNFNVDSLLKGYRVVKNINVPEFRMTVSEMIHEGTNATHIHLNRDDKNKTFAVQFRTPAPNDSGVPHILEHTVLCGSHKYPVRDPFFKMLSRSQATFMNAYTGTDWTLYPFSSMNNTDFHNLLSVYLDAVFKPRLSEHDFMQEGWRLEPPDLSETSSLPQHFLLKGVVYNEMKGVFASKINNLIYKVGTSILPETYPFISGGDPKCIPELTHAHLKGFHKKLYHPSNSKFFTYGDVDLESVLDRINTEYLSDFTAKIDLNTLIPLEPRWKSPKTIDISCNFDPMAADPERQSSVAISFAIDDVKKTYLNFTMKLVGSLLMDGDNAPLYQALIESGVGLDWIDSLCGFDNSTRTSLFHIGVQGVQEKDLDRVDGIVLEVLEKVIRDGFPQERLQSLIHQIELGIRHDSADFGLRVILALSSPVNHEASLEDSLKSLEYIGRLKKDLATNPQYLESILRQNLLENTHRLTVRMIPSKTFDTDRLAQEQKLVEDLNIRLLETDKRVITEKCRHLQQVQRRTENVNCLPCLHVSDIATQAEKFPFQTNDELKCQINKYNTNGILYLKMTFDLHGIDTALLQYLPLLSSVFTSMSTSSMHYREIDQLAESCSGGLSSSVHLCGNTNRLESDDIRAGFLLSSHCLYENTSRMLNLWSKIINDVQFDDFDRLSTLIRMQMAGSWSADAISGSAHSFAMRRAASTLTPVGRLSEHLNGLEQAILMKSFATMTTDSLKETIVPKLIKLKQLIFRPDRLRFAINCEDVAIDNTISMLNVFKLAMSAADGTMSKQVLKLADHQDLEKQCHFVLPYPVNYVASCIKTVPYTHQDYATIRVLSKLLSLKFLHNQIREIGGAYGGGVFASPGHLNFYSYRDPETKKTLGVFDKSFDWALNSNIENQSLDEAKLSVFQELDKPISAGSKGLVHFLDMITDEMRQQHRDRLFKVTVEDVKRVTEQLKNCNDRSRVIIGPDQKDLGDEWKKILFDK